MMPPATDLDARVKPLRLMVFDVDGVLTDGSLYYSDTGAESKAFNAGDGQGIRLLRDAGFKLAIITSRRSALVERRARDLGLHYCFQGVEAKLATFDDILAELKFAPAQAGYMGDDLLDLPVLLRAGFAATVPHAPAVLVEHAHFIASRPAGAGAVREVCEMILRRQGVLDSLVAAYLR